MTRLVVAPGGVITSAWGNATHDQSTITFTSTTQRDADWPAPPDGARCYVTGVGWQRRDAGTWKTDQPAGAAAGRQEQLWLPVVAATLGNFPADSTERAIPASGATVPVPPWASTLQVTALAVDFEPQTPGVSAFNYNNRLRLAGSVLYGTSVRSRGQSAHCYASWPVTAYRGTSQPIVWMLNAISGSSQINVAVGSTAFTYLCLFT
jgi:ABC-type uncharacterized transport system YnjBCD substrate-binding protein